MKKNSSYEKKIVQMNIKIVQMKLFKMRKISSNENNSSKEKKIVQMK